jgi:hypothetical protein
VTYLVCLVLMIVGFFFEEGDACMYIVCSAAAMSAAVGMAIVTLT